MGLPELNIAFKKKASATMSRGSRGKLLVILNDKTSGETVNAYAGLEDVNKKEFTEKSYEYITMAFSGSPSLVYVVRAVQDEDEVDMAATMQLVKRIRCDWFCYPQITPEQLPVVVSGLKNMRKMKHFAKAVLPNAKQDCEAIVNFTTDNVLVKWSEDSEPVTYSTAEYCVRIASLLAGLPLTMSSTFYTLSEVIGCDLKENEDTCIEDGELILIFDEDYKIGKGVTSLTSNGEDVPVDFKKIKCMEGGDLILATILDTIKETYVGKVLNSYANKQMLVGAINEYLISLEDTVIDKEETHSVAISLQKNKAYLKAQGIDISELSDEDILKANTGAYIGLSGKCRMLDAMEDFDIDIEL